MTNQHQISNADAFTLRTFVRFGQSRTAVRATGAENARFYSVYDHLPPPTRKLLPKGSLRGFAKLAAKTCEFEK